MSRSVEAGHDKPEDSIALRTVCCAMTVIAIVAAYLFGESPVPVLEFSYYQGATMLICVWLCVGGCLVSFQLRKSPVVWLTRAVYIATVLVLVNLARELVVENMYAVHFQFLRPLVHSCTAASVINSFELRTRGDINRLAAFGLVLLVLAASSGRSVLFGICVFVYVCLGVVLLFLDCRSRCADSLPASTPAACLDLQRLQQQSRWPLPVLAIFPLLTLLFFFVIPRADSLADTVSARVLALTARYIHDLGQKGAAQKSQANTPPGTAAGTVDGARTARRFHAHRSHVAAGSGYGSDSVPPRSSKQTYISLRGAKRTRAPEKDLRAGGSRQSRDGQPGGKVACLKESGEALARAAGQGEGGQESIAGGGWKKADGMTGGKSAGSDSDSNGKSAGSDSDSNSNGGSDSDGNSDSKISCSKESGEQSAPDASSESLRPGKVSRSAQSKSVAGVAGSQGAGGAQGSKSDVKSEVKDKENSISAATDQGSLKATAARDAEGGTRERASVAGSASDLADEKDELAETGSLSLTGKSRDFDRLLFRVASNRSVYFRLTCLDEFDGGKWKRSSGKEVQEFSRQRSADYQFDDCPALAVPSTLSTLPLTQNFFIESNLGANLPAAAVPERLSIISPRILVDDCGTVTSSVPLPKGCTYSVVSHVPVYSLPELRNASISDFEDEDGPDISESCLQLPDNQSLRLDNLAATLEGAGGNRFVLCERIVGYLRDNCKYTVEPARGDQGDNLVDKFLFVTRKGDCKDFASSFVMLARASGIPSRLVIGYMPGAVNNLTGAMEVRVKHYHAWAEAYLPPFGWVPFDAVPGGALPSRSDEKYYNWKAVGEHLAAQSREVLSGSAGRGFKSLFEILDAGLRIVFAALAVLGLWFAARAAFAGWRQWRKERECHPACRIYRKVVKELKAMGVEKLPADTAGDLSLRLKGRLDGGTAPDPGCSADLSGKLDDFATTFNAVYFGNQDRLSELEQLGAVLIARLRQTGR